VSVTEDTDQMLTAVMGDLLDNCEAIGLADDTAALVLVYQPNHPEKKFSARLFDPRLPEGEQPDLAAFLRELADSASDGTPLEAEFIEHETPGVR